MDKLLPLRQWVCDTCHEVIEEPSHGYIEWERHLDTGRHYGFRIVHHASQSPLKPSRTCYTYNAGLTSNLEDFLGPDGFIQFMSLVDPGKYHLREFDGPQVEDVREWATFGRRLHVPYFEEARLYLSAASAEGEVGGLSEVALYQADMMEQIVDDYRPGGNRR